MTGNAKQTYDVYTDELLRIAKVSGFLMPFAIALFGIGVKFGLFNDDYYHSDAALVLISGAMIALGIWQLYTSNYESKTLSINVALYHLLGSLAILFITGFMNPIFLAWAILSVITDMLFGRKALFLSILALGSVAWLHLARQPLITTEEMLFTIGIVGMVAALSSFMSYLRDVSDRERLAYHKVQKRENLQHDRLTTLINAMNDAVISTNQKGVIRLYNAATLNLLDTNKTLAGLSINSSLNLYDDDGNPVNIMELIKDTPRTFIRNLSHKYDDGETIDLSISVAPISPSYHQRTQKGYIFVLRDITKEKSLEEERDEFISVVSHELRTPIAITEGNLSNIKLLMERGEQGRLLSKAIDDAHDQVIYLARMINDLSTLSRAERGVADDPEDIDVNEMMEALYNEYRPQAEAKGLSLNIDLHGRVGIVKASRLYLEEVLQNFITNSIKYTHKGSVTISAKKIPGGEVEFLVKDTGIGISKTDQKHIYQKFYRSEDYRTRETNGTGLGLYVVQKLSQKLGIRVTLKSRLNHGSTFSFTMPLVKK